MEKNHHKRKKKQKKIKAGKNEKKAVQPEKMKKDFLLVYKIFAQITWNDQFKLVTTCNSEAIMITGISEIFEGFVPLR